MKKLYWIIFGCLCISISVHPIKYFMADEPILLLTSKSAELLSSGFYNLSFYAHISLGGVALLVGWVQFIKKLRLSYPKIHRMIGKIYVGSVLISGPFGFYIALHASGGLSPKLGFGIGAVLWTMLTYFGFTAIKKGDVASHRKLMMYSYAGTFGAVTLRLWMPVLIFFMGGFTDAYKVVAWLSWLPNVLAVYLFTNHHELLVFVTRALQLKKVAIGATVIIPVTIMLSYMSPQDWFYKAPSMEGVAFEEASSLASSYFSKEKLDEIETYLKDESQTTSMLVLEHGKKVYEYGDISELSYIASCRKSVLSILYGKYVADGTINLEEQIGAMGIDEDDGLLPIEKEAKVDHIITSRSGVFHLPANGGYDERNVKARGSVAPGAYFVYNNWDFNVAGHILEVKTGNSVYQEMEEQLAVPLGFQDWNIENQSRTTNEEKSRYSAYHMHISTRDMAKIGQLMLQKGNWKGKQLVPQDWIQKITTQVTSRDTVAQRIGQDISSPLQLSYGYMWWIYERLYDNPDFDGAYTASGHGGQYITVIPKRGIVIAHKTKIDLLTTLGYSNRSSTPDWQYWWILRNLMLNRKSLASLSDSKSTDGMISFIKDQYQGESDYAISERLLNEYGQELAAKGRCEEAIQFYNLNLDLYPHGYYTHRTFDYLGDCLEKLGRKEDAIEAYEQSITFNGGGGHAKRQLVRMMGEIRE